MHNCSVHSTVFVTERLPNNAKSIVAARDQFKRLYFIDYCMYDKRDFERRLQMLYRH